jgi:hypothetical protein
MRWCIEEEAGGNTHNLVLSAQDRNGGTWDICKLPLIPETLSADRGAVAVSRGAK